MSLPRLLVADDHETLREALVELLRKACFEVVGEACDGADAVALAKQPEPDVVLMDLRMPGLGGLDATRLIKDACPVLQVVLLTAFESLALRGGLERRARGRRLPGHRRLADVAAHRRFGAHPSPAAGLPSDVRELRHLRWLLRRPNHALTSTRVGVERSSRQRSLSSCTTSQP